MNKVLTEQRSRAPDRNGTQEENTIHAGGTLQILPPGFGFLRHGENSYLSSSEDIYVAASQIRRFGLQTGMVIEGVVRLPADEEEHPALVRIESVNGKSPEEASNRTAFEELTSAHPDQRFVLETDAEEINMRVLDLMTPVGKGQRGLIVSPPRAGKTILLQLLAQAILHNHPECYMFVLLIDERPEEVTDMQKNLRGERVEVPNSTFDRPAAEHTHVAEIVLEKAKRMVEEGQDVVILLDSVTRLARAHNQEAPSSGKLLSGGITAGALQPPKKFFGAARKVEEGGSLTILGTALVETGSRMDQVIFEEFKGTGNMEIHLDRQLAEQRIWPAVNLNASGTRREELLLHPDELDLVWQLRRTLSALNPAEAMQLLTSRLRKTQSNAEFLMSMQLK